MICVLPASLLVFINKMKIPPHCEGMIDELFQELLRVLFIPVAIDLQNITTRRKCGYIDVLVCITGIGRIDKSSGCIKYSHLDLCCCEVANLYKKARPVSRTVFDKAAGVVN